MSLTKQLFEIPGCDPSLPIKPALIHQLTWLYISHDPLDGFLPDDLQTINGLICNICNKHDTLPEDGTNSVSFAPAGFRRQVSNKKKKRNVRSDFQNKACWENDHMLWVLDCLQVG